MAHLVVLEKPAERDPADTFFSMQQEDKARRTTARLAWAARPIAERLRVLKTARHALALQTEALCAAVSPDLARTPADTLVAEVLPLLAACRFLEREARTILASRWLGRQGLPFWLTGVDAEVQRSPMGEILIIAPSNYPLLLPGVQALQALAAGNAVTWKPGRNGAAVARLFAEILFAAGLPRDLLRVTDDSVSAATLALSQGIDKVFFTGSAESGRAVMRRCAETLTPSVMELSGCDAVVVLPSADLDRVVKALAFGMRLNGSATCMAPRRVLVLDPDGTRESELARRLLTAFDWLPGINLPATARHYFMTLLQEAEQDGALVLGERSGTKVTPILVRKATPAMRLAQSDIFAPLLMLMSVRDIAALCEAQQICPFSLTVSIFGQEQEASALAQRLEAGTIIINDLIVPTADPRVPFGGRRRSGFGVTRGREGLLEMTAAKVVSVRRGRTTRHYDATTPQHEDLFTGLITASHASDWKLRWNGLQRLLNAARKMR